MKAKRPDAKKASPVPSPPPGARSPAEAIALREGPQGVYVKVTARPGTGTDRLMGVQGDALKLGVSAAPEKGKAK